MVEHVRLLTYLRFAVPIYEESKASTQDKEQRMQMDRSSDAKQYQSEQTKQSKVVTLALFAPSSVGTLIFCAVSFTGRSVRSVSRLRIRTHCVPVLIITWLLPGDLPYLRNRHFWHGNWEMTWSYSLPFPDHIDNSFIEIGQHNPELRCWRLHWFSSTWFAESYRDMIRTEI